MAIVTTSAEERSQLIKPYIEPVRNLRVECLKGFVEYYRHSPAVAFKLPPCSHHWLVLQDRVYPEHVLLQFGTKEACLSRHLDMPPLIYIPPFTPTEWDFSKVDACIHVLIPDSLLLEVYQGENYSSTCMLDSMSMVLGGDSPELAREMRSLLPILQSGETPTPLLMADYLYRVTEKLIASRQIRPERKLHSSKIPKNQMARLYEYMIQYIHLPIQLEELANLIGLSQFHFSRCFKQTTNQTPHQYLTALRITRARILIGKLNLVEVTYACGFSDQAHFTRTFKRWTGMTPSQYKSAAC